MDFSFYKKDGIWQVNGRRTKNVPTSIMFNDNDTRVTMTMGNIISFNDTLITDIRKSDTEQYSNSEFMSALASFLSQTSESSTPAPILGQYMDTVGDGTGIFNMSVDGSNTPVKFMVKPPVGIKYMVSRLIFSLRDSGSLDSGGWGNNQGSELTSGIGLDLKQNSTTYPLIRNKIKSHYDIASMCHDVVMHSWGAGDSFLTARYTFTKLGQYILLDGDNGDELSITISDNLSYLKDQKVSVQGYILF